ncbi:hypothetical protein IGI04_034608 [Brassica rapa subsp. trilocularis]|uniref:DOG1 domain-containing protein n=1 Tax=Brassica rapa subsp. trilocularis TaxID=1813537 RepID=A0ABQ7L9A2_BRACM|nr:hypothetical protein IGI04_034608 [Brassica rapa subsp. trilocularis]
MTLERPLRATYQGRSRSRATRWSDTPRSLATSRPETPKIGPGATSRSDTCKSLRSLLRIVSRLKVDSLIDHLPSLVRYLITQGQEELCFINNNGSWYKKEPNFQYNNYQQKSYPNNQQSGYPPRNNQQGSYQPQQNPSSGSSAPQESSTDTLLKQILESQTRSEKQVGYELKNLHSKIDGSYNELNNKFSHLASTVFEYHMEFLETFGCIWSSKEVIRVVFGRALPGATSRSDFSERLHEVAVHHIPERLIQSDCTKSLAFSHPETHIFDPGATFQSDVLKSLPMFRATCWSDTPRSLAFVLSETLKVALERLAGATPASRSAALISLRTGSTIFYTTTFVLGALKTPNIKCGSGYLDFFRLDIQICNFY